MIILLHYLAIVVLESYILYCEYRLWKILKRLSDRKTDNRRAKYRAKAYSQKNKEAVIAENRKALWRMIRKQSSGLLGKEKT